MTTHNSECGKKQRFPTRGEAKAAAREASAILNENLHAYKCRFGAHFHFGHVKRYDDAGVHR